MKTFWTQNTCFISTFLNESINFQEPKKHSENVSFYSSKNGKQKPSFTLILFKDYKEEFTTL